MGGSIWSDAHYQDKAQLRAASGQQTFGYHVAQASKPPGQRTAHDTLSPKGVKIRESRDSQEHPLSRAIACFLDVTGSMGKVPRTIQANLPKLMGLLLRKSAVTDPQIMIGAVGDAHTDEVPLQVGQFESGIEIEENLTNLFLEGNGGGQVRESYDLAMYFLARKTALDCFEKRGLKGYCFLIGDEMPYDVVKRQHVLEVIGDGLEADIKIEDMMRELQEKYVVFYILPKLTSYYDDPKVASRWKELLGENFLKLKDPEGICELIASTIALCEGVDIDRVTTDLQESGTSLATIGAVKDALSPVASSNAKQGGAISVPDSGNLSGVATL